ncbi:hypothetical protein [Pseudomonas lactucae]|uniref:hypothetical protein n=1 Tax=Pseudomonas lactucae TaxID=2813360 RepID=UPI0005B40A69
MDTVFIHKTGIHPWAYPHPTEDQGYVTITLLNQDFESVWKTWLALALVLKHEWPVILTWYTTRAPKYSKTQEYLALKRFAKSAAPKDIFRKNEETSIYSGVEHLNTNPEHIDPNKLKTYRSHVTLMTKQDYQAELLWQRLSHLKYISTTDDLKLILADEEILAFRFYDSETHGVAQIICHSIHAPRLEHAISTLNIKEIPHTGVYEYIHS